MSFTVSSAELNEQLSHLAGVVPSKSVLPIIQNIHFKLEGNQLQLTATDLDNSIQTTLQVDGGGEAMDVALPAKLLLDTLKALPEQPITFKLTGQGFAVQLATANGQYELTGANGEDFPDVPAPEETTKIQMPLDALTRAIQKTLFAASSDELKPALNGMFFDFKSSGATFVATDAHRLVRYRRLDVTVDQETSFILPQKALRLLNSAAGDTEDDLTIEYNESNAFFSFGAYRLSCRLIDARFPDYENVIPSSSPSKLVINKKELLGSLRRLDIFSNKTTHLGRFSMSDGQLAVQAEDLDFSNKANETLACVFEGNAIEIGFNVSLMQEIIGNVETGDLNVELDTPGRAAVVLPSEQEEGEHLLMLLMPVMLSAN